MIGRVDFDGGVLFLDHTGLFELETVHGIEPEDLFSAVLRPSGLRAIVSVALSRAKARDLATDLLEPEAMLDEMPHQEAVRLAVRCVHLSVFGRPPPEAEESAEGKEGAPVTGSSEV